MPSNLSNLSLKEAVLRSRGLSRLTDIRHNRRCCKGDFLSNFLINYNTRRKEEIRVVDNIMIGVYLLYGVYNEFYISQSNALWLNRFFWLVLIIAAALSYLSYRPGKIGLVTIVHCLVIVRASLDQTFYFVFNLQDGMPPTNLAINITNNHVSMLYMVLLMNNLIGPVISFVVGIFVLWFNYFLMAICFNQITTKTNDWASNFQELLLPKHFWFMIFNLAMQSLGYCSMMLLMQRMHFCVKNTLKDNADKHEEMYMLLNNMEEAVFLFKANVLHYINNTGSQMLQQKQPSFFPTIKGEAPPPQLDDFKKLVLHLKETELDQAKIFRVFRQIQDQNPLSRKDIYNTSETQNESQVM